VLFKSRKKCLFIGLLYKRGVNNRVRAKTNIKLRREIRNFSRAKDAMGEKIVKTWINIIIEAIGIFERSTKKLENNIEYNTKVYISDIFNSL